jgi:ketosteroid isomerase-like protein
MVAAWIVSAALVQNVSVAPHQSPDTVELTRLEQVWNEAHRHGSADALERLWAEDLVVAVPKMRTFTRAEALDMVRSGRMPFERYETSDLRVRLYGDAAVVTGRLQRTRRIGGGAVDDNWLFTKVYVRLQGQWRVVAFHASETPQ